ncbi:MAG: type II toxin-antitoxin system RnlA family toxin [Bacteroidales bacterium]|nr:type II toxin-antitoxin system RnlA family toxin [Bacteroidales bacterium]
MSIKKCLYRNKIEEAIKAFAPEGATIRQRRQTKNAVQYTMSFPGTDISPAMLIVYCNNDGTTTLNCSQGRNPEFSAKWAESVASSTEVVLYDTNNLYFKSIDEEQFDYLKEYMSECNTTCTRRILSNGCQYSFCGEYGDMLFATRYNNGAILFQGHPSLTFNHAITALADIYPSDVLLVGLTTYYKLDYRRDDMLEELMNVCPNLVGKLSNDIVDAMLPAIGLRRAIPAGLTDYSYLCFPVLRGLEGILKTLFKERGVVISATGNFGGYLKYDDVTRIASFEPAQEGLFIDPTEKDRVKSLYALLRQQRHRIFHFDTMAPIILSKEDAIDILEETLKTINDAY